MSVGCVLANQALRPERLALLCLTQHDVPMLPGHPVVNETFLLTKCDYFVDVQVWPLMDQCNPRGWLSNFDQHEQVFARQLLNSFMFFRQPMMDALLLAAVQGLSQRLCEGQPFVTAQRTWRSFVDAVLVTRVTGETPSEADSGYHYLRLARQILDISEDQIVSPEGCIQKLLGEARPVVFLDDFVGSGDGTDRAHR